MFKRSLIAIALAMVAAPVFAAEPQNHSAYSDSIDVDHDAKTITVAESASAHIVNVSLRDIMYQAASTPVTDPEGDQIGYMLTEIDPGSVYETIGLRNGDVVTAINDVPLTTPQTAYNMLMYVKGERELTYTVRRYANYREAQRWKVFVK